MNRKVKKAIKRTPKSILICTIVFLILGFVIGFSIITIISKNDTFELIGEKSITLNINEEYKEEGVNAISLGKDIKDKLVIEGNIDTSTPGEYTLIYTLKDSFKYKNIKRVRYIKVLNGSDNHE